MQTRKQNQRAWIWVCALIAPAAAGVFGFITDKYFNMPNATEVSVVMFFTGLVALPSVYCAIKEPVLFVGLLPAMAIWLSRIIPELLVAADGDGTKNIIIMALFLMTIGNFLLACWAPVTWFLFWLHRSCKERLVLGPLAELCAAISLMAPWIVGAFVLPPAVSADSHIFTITASIGISLLWSKVLSEPFARLVRALREQS